MWKKITAAAMAVLMVFGSGGLNASADTQTSSAASSAAPAETSSPSSSPTASPVSSPSASPASSADPAETETAAEDESEEQEDLSAAVSASGFTDEGYQMEALEIRKEDTLSQYQTILEDREIVEAFDVSVLNGTVEDPEKGVEVVLTLDKETELPDDIDLSSVGLYHIRNFDSSSDDSEHNIVERIDYAYDRDARTLTFTADSFSPFVLAYQSEEEKAAEKREQNTEKADSTEQPDQSSETVSPDSEENSESTEQNTAKADSTEEPDQSAETVSPDSGKDSESAAQSTAEAAPLMLLEESNDSIVTFNASLRYGAELNDNGDYVWTADTAEAGHGFVYRVTYATSGVGFYEPGQVQITIPKSILKNREGNPSDFYEMSLPEENDPDITADTEFVYREDGDNIVVYNRKQIPAGENGYFEISYNTAEKSFAYADYQSGTNDVSSPVTAVIDANGVTAAAEAPAVSIDTTAEITSTLKRHPSFYESWQSSWGEEPEDADKYYYLDWEIRSCITASQPYTFTLNDTFSDGEVVGYKLQGEEEFTDKNSIDNQTENYQYGRYDHVLTRISKDEYDLKDTWSVRNEIDAVVEPIDKVDSKTQASSSKEFYFERATFKVPGVKYETSKYGLDYDNRIVYNSNSLRLYQNELKNFNTAADGEEIGDFGYYSYIKGYPYPDTLEEDADPLDPDNYGKEKVTYTLIDDSIDVQKIMNGKAVGLTAPEQIDDDDYRVTGLDLDYYAQNAVYNDSTETFEANEAENSELTDDVIKIYVRLSNSEDFIEAGTYNVGTDELSILDSDLISRKDPDYPGAAVGIKFNQDTAGYKLVTENAHYYMNLRAYPHISLIKNSKTSKLSDGDKLKVTNNCTGYVSKNGTVLYCDNNSGSDYAGSPVFQSNITKKAVSVENSKTSKTAAVTWNTVMYEENATLREYAEQNSGKFYDLLPEGSSYQNGSMIVKADNTELSNGEFETEVIENYKNTGRTMLVISVKQPAGIYDLTYKTVSSWDALNDYGTTLLNTVAYQTGNKSLADGRPDDGGTVKEKEIMKDLDETTDDELFIYTDAAVPVRTITAASLGLYKKVKSEEDKDYSTSTTTYTDDSYSYKLRFSTDEISKAEDLILFDSLENYSASEGESSDWHGTLESIDTSYIESLGIKPVIYYCTKDRSEIGMSVSTPKTEAEKIFSPAALEDSSVWSTERPSDMSKVTAFAIDMRKAEDGSNYVLPVDTAVAATVYMRAPDKVVSDKLDLKAYNNIYLYNTQISETGMKNTDLVHQDYTDITYRTVGNLTLHKVDSNDHETAIAGIQFRIWGTSDYGTEIDETKKTASDGNITFKKLERGTYSLQEIQGIDDYLENHDVMTVAVDENGKITVNGNEPESDGSFTIENTPRVHNDIEFNKKSFDGQDIKGAVFRLEGVSAYGNDILMYATSDSTGKVYFKNVEYGSYTMTEVQTPEGCIPPQAAWQVTCDSNGIITIDGAEKDLAGHFIIRNESYHSFTILKQNARTGEPAGGAEFRLTGTSDYGHAVDLTAESDKENGFAVFENLESGTYVLEEIKAPTSYMHTENGKQTLTEAQFNRDETKRAVTVAEDGTVTIDGLEINEYGQFPYNNSEVPSGTVVVTKKWKDGLTGSDADSREYPNITISTDRPADESQETESGNTGNDSEQSGEETEPGTIKYSGTWGTCKWTIDSNGTLTIGEGRGANEYYWYYIQVPSWNDYAGSIKRVRTSGKVVFPYMSEDLFFGCYNLSDIDGLHAYDGTNGVDTSNVHSMAFMFTSCSSLTNLDALKDWDLTKVTGTKGETDGYGLGYMFHGCSSLTDIKGLADWDVSNVKRFQDMFCLCNSLKSTAQIKNWNTSAAEDMQGMFYECSNLEKVDFSNWNSSGTEQSNMLYGCNKLKTVITGPDFSLDSTVLCDPPEDSQYTGKWTSRSPYNHSGQLNASQLMNQDKIETSKYTWYWEEKSEDQKNHQYYYSDQGVNKDDKTEHNVLDTGKTAEEQAAQIETFVDADGNPTGYWTKISDDTWTYTYYVYDPDVKWYVWEDAFDRYESDCTIKKPAEVETGERGTVTNNKDDYDKKYGSLSLTKKIIDQDNNELTDSSASFVFTVTLKDSDGNSLSGNAIFGSTVFRDGVAKVVLKDDESITFTDIPKDYQYEITEDTVNGYSQNTFENWHGKIDGGTVKEAVCRNVKESGSVTNGFVLTKKCSEDTSEEFTFSVSLSGLSGNRSYSYQMDNSSEMDTFTADSSGNVNIILKLKDGEKAEFTDLPIGSQYRIAEEANEMIAAYTVKKETEAGSVSSTSGRNSDKNTVLSTAAETVDKDEKVTVTFNNHKKTFRIPFLKLDPYLNYVNGANLQVFNQDNEVIDSWTSAENMVHYSELSEGTYTLHEESVPEPYKTAEDISFTVSDDGTAAVNGENTDQVVMVDEIEKTEISVRKTDGTNSDLSGAVLQIDDAYGNMVDSWTTDGTEHKVQLERGESYVLRETQTPDGYAFAKDISFSIDDEGKLFVDGTEQSALTITMIDVRLAQLPSSGSEDMRSLMVLLLIGLALFGWLAVRDHGKQES